MQRYFFSRLVQSILILLGVLTLVFFMVRVSGDPASLMMPKEASLETIEAFREKMGFNRPLPVQYLDFLFHAIQGDFGNSLHFKTPALEMVLQRLPATVQLAGAGLFLAILIAIPLGLIGGSTPGSLWDNAGRLLGLLGQSIPNFWLALVLIFIFAVRLRLLPSFGRDELKSLILPAVVMGLPVMGSLVRLTRSAVMEIRGEDYIRTAYSKGLDPRKIYYRHILLNAAIPLISVIGVDFGYMLGGSIYIETIFSWPGMGQLIEQAIGWRDYTLIQAIAFFSSLVVVGLNLLTDLAYSLVDPRIRYG
ncbi:MAG: ABC transporter permease [Chloroflexi bacterium]|nr:ABC transporter permease [Chloroflexota bacterium]